jgi:hypothetical protein
MRKICGKSGPEYIGRAFSIGKSRLRIGAFSDIGCVAGGKKRGFCRLR